MRESVQFLRVCFFVGALALTLPGQRAVSAQATEPGRIEGLVVRAISGQPIPRARVSLRLAGRRGRNRNLIALTDANGWFEFSQVPAGEYSLRAERNGFVTQDYGQTQPGRPGKPIALRPGQTVRDIAFWMQEAAVITGRVYDDYGDPIVGTQVRVLEYRYRDGRRDLTQAGRATTNDLGEYRVFGLPPGTYYVEAAVPNRSRGGTFELRVSQAAGQELFNELSRVQAVLDSRGPSTEDGPKEDYAPTYYPGTADLERASPVKLRPGEERGAVDFALAKVRTARITGRVVPPGTANRPTRFRVSLLPIGGRLYRTDARRSARVNRTDGTFHVTGAIPGEYYIFASMRSGKEQYSGLVPVTVGGGDIEGITIHLNPGVPLQGHVRTEETAYAPKPRSGSTGNGDGGLPLNSLRVVLRPDVQTSIGASATSVSKTGEFSFSNLLNLLYRLEVARVPEGYFLKSAKLNGQELLEKGLDLRGGFPGHTLEIVLSDNGAMVQGRVLDTGGNPAGGVTVTLTPIEDAFRRSDLFKTTSADEDGRFALQGLAPGTYRIHAWEDLEPGAHRDPEFLQRFEDDAEEIRLGEGERKTVELELIPADKTRLQ